MITGGSPQISQSNEIISKILKENSNISFKSIEAPSNNRKSITNFPFVMMDPKYGFVENNNNKHSSQSQVFNDTQTTTLAAAAAPHQLSPIYVNNTDSTSNSMDTPSSSNSSSSLTPLRIHQWKNYQDKL